MSETPLDESETRDVAAERGETRRAVIGAGVLGFGFSGLVDVLVLHHVLQLHHLLSNVYPTTTLAGLRTNLLADGLFSLVMVVIAGVGAGLAWRAERRTPDPLPVRPLAGASVVGLGVFDLFDVLVNHVVLGLHHATSGPGYYDPHWFVISVLIIGGGAYVYRTSSADTAGSGA